MSRQQKLPNGLNAFIAQYQVAERNPADNTLAIRTYTTKRPHNGRVIATIAPQPHYDDNQAFTASLMAHSPRLYNMLNDACLQLSRLTGENLEAYARTFAACASVELNKIEMGG